MYFNVCPGVTDCTFPTLVNLNLDVFAYIISMSKDHQCTACTAKQTDTDMSANQGQQGENKLYGNMDLSKVGHVIVDSSLFPM